MSDKPTVTLGYWSIRGLAEPLRCLLHHCNVKFNDVTYACGDAPGFDLSDWFNVKHKLGLPFPNLPYLIDEATGLKMTQSDAILRHIGREHNLVGSTPLEKAEVDMLVDLAKDIAMGLTRVVYNPKFSELIGDLSTKTAPAWLQLLSDHLGSKEWFAGSLSIADFVLYERLDVLNHLIPGSVDAHANLKAFMTRFEALPRVAEFVASAEHKSLKFNNKMAVWQ
ncbi:glutathione S-transferase Mu 5-like protein [Tribonema minus]|uniref:glutathione transferase n=1 Tax=Tribonema minus TaxID=303371 RepID=A0A836CMK4_9STRA|nr:glutathione S-transferase Mu 5-like protein [Tribonema minus]